MVTSCFNRSEMELGVTHKTHRRNLAGVMDATKSTITGITENLPFIKGSTYTFIVTAKDSAGVNVGSGGEKVYIKVTDHCTRNTLMTCDDVTSSTSVIGGEVIVLLTDVGDGTYTYTATYNDLGNITAAIMLTHTEGANGLIYESLTYGTGTGHPVSFR